MIDKNRPLGPNVKRLIAMRVAREVVPPGVQDGFQRSIDVLINPVRLQAVSVIAVAWVQQAIDAVKSAPDNPYGDDDETIAAAILKQAGDKGVEND